MGAKASGQIRASIVGTLKSPVGATAIGMGAALVVLAVLGLAPRLDPGPAAIVTPPAVAAEPPRAATVPIPRPPMGDSAVLDRRDETLDGTFEHLDTDGWLAEPAARSAEGAVEEVALNEDGAPAEAAPAEPLALREGFDASAGAAEPADPSGDGATVADTQTAASPDETVPVDPPADTQPANDTKTVKGAGVTVRSGPSKSNKRLFALPGGADVTVNENHKGWLRITDVKGRTGWVYSDYLR